MFLASAHFCQASFYPFSSVFLYGCPLAPPNPTPPPPLGLQSHGVAGLFKHIAWLCFPDLSLLPKVFPPQTAQFKAHPTRHLPLPFPAWPSTKSQIRLLARAPQWRIVHLLKVMTPGSPCRPVFFLANNPGTVRFFCLSQILSSLSTVFLLFNA